MNRTFATSLLLGVLWGSPAWAETFTVPKEEAWRAARPKPGAPREPALPTFQKATLSNGLTLLVAENQALPLVSFSLVIKGGAAVDPPGKAGLMSLTYAMLDEGAGDLDALAFADRLADLGAGFGAAGDRDSGALSISGLSRNSDPMLGLLALAAMQPRLQAVDFERVKAQTLAAMERRRSSPQGLAFEELPGILYGADHPLGHPPTGSPTSVSPLTLDDVKAQHAKVFGPKSAALIVSGALGLDAAKALAETHFGKWQSGAEPPPAIPGKQAEARKSVIIIDKAPAPQTVAILARPIFGRGHPDEVPLTLANVIFGGAFTSRLNLNLREDKGYTYGAGSQAIFRQGVGAFVAMSALRQDATAAGLKETIKELEGMKKKPPTKAEIDDAKSSLIRSLTGDFETNGAIAGAAAGIFVNDLPLDYFQKLPERYAKVSVADIRRVSSAYLAPNLMKVVLVGDQAVIGPTLAPLKLGTLEVRKP